MTSNHGVRSDETGPIKGPPQQHGSLTSPKDCHTISLIKFLTRNLTSQRRSLGQKLLTSTLVLFAMALQGK